MPAHRKETPAEGTLRGVILSLYGQPRHFIAEEATRILERKIEILDVTRGIGSMRRDGKLPGSTDEEKKRVLRESHLEGSLLSITAPYAKLGMSAKEIIAAVKLTHGIGNLVLEKVHNVARHVRALEREGERLDMPKQGKMTKETRWLNSLTVEERTGLWLDSVVLTLMFPVQVNVWPHSREGWAKLTAQYKQRGLVSSGAQRWIDLVHRLSKASRPILSDWSVSTRVSARTFLFGEYENFFTIRKQGEIIVGDTLSTRLFPNIGRGYVREVVYEEDDLGFYYFDNDGNKWRPLDSEDGLSIDSSFKVKRRQGARRRIDREFRLESPDVWSDTVKVRRREGAHRSTSHMLAGAHQEEEEVSV